MGISHDWKQDTGQGVVTTLNLSKIITDSTSVTPAEVLDEPAEAPPGFEDPGGDPDTSGGIGDDIDLGFSAIGQLLVGSDAVGGWDTLDVGTDGQVLTVDPDEVLGVKWAAASGGAGGKYHFSLFTSGDVSGTPVLWGTSAPGIFCATGVPTDCDTMFVFPGAGTCDVYAILYSWYLSQSIHSAQNEGL